MVVVGGLHLQKTYRNAPKLIYNWEATVSGHIIFSQLLRLQKSTEIWFGIFTPNNNILSGSFAAAFYKSIELLFEEQGGQQRQWSFGRAKGWGHLAGWR